MRGRFRKGSFVRFLHSPNKQLVWSFSMHIYSLSNAIYIQFKVSN